MDLIIKKDEKGYPYYAYEWQGKPVRAYLTGNRTMMLENDLVFVGGWVPGTLTGRRILKNGMDVLVEGCIESRELAQAMLSATA